MKIDVGSLRSDAEKIEDPARREEALCDLRELESLELDTQRQIDEINREFKEKQAIYKPQSKIRLTLFTILSLLASAFAIVSLRDILATGSYAFNRTHHTITVGANPIAYWIYVGVFILFVFLFIFSTLVFVLALLKYPHPPFNWMPKKRVP